MFYNCNKLKNYQSSSDDIYRSNKYAFPDNGVKGYFTSKNPLIKLLPIEGGHYEDAQGNRITEIRGSYPSGEATIKAVYPEDEWDEEHEIKMITNNAYDCFYDFADDGTFTVKFLAEYSISVTTGLVIEPYAALTHPENGTGDTLTFRYDGDRYWYDFTATTFEVINTGDAPG